MRDVSNEERNDDLQYRAVGNTVAVQAGVQHGQDVGDNMNLTARCRWSRTVSVPACVRSVLVALGVFAGLIASVGARRRQRSLFEDCARECDSGFELKSTARDSEICHACENEQDCLGGRHVFQ